MSAVGTGDKPLEPEVLAVTKQALFPPNADRGYAVTDTQFAKETWVAGKQIPTEIREILTPFNHVRIGTGYPDLVGIGRLQDRFIQGGSTNKVSESRPLVAVEAKGYTQGNVDVGRGILQAHDRLTDANVVYLSAPASAITPPSRNLARDLNVGIIAIGGNGVEVLETPRIVGSQTPDAARAIRFQATAHGVADQSFGLNHPKNYLAYPLAEYHPEPTEEILSRHVVGAVDAARQGAAFLGLVYSSPKGTVELTNLGREVVRIGTGLEGSVDAALRRFEDWQRSRERFIDIAGEWGQLARWVVYEYPATELLVEQLQQLHDEGNEEPTLQELVLAIHDGHPVFAVELFIRGTDTAREAVFREDDSLDPEALSNGNVYAAPTTFQLKAMLYHAGILTERGAEPHRLNPTEDVWQLRTPV
ncbi:MAG: hypothetical protein U5K70_00930 [Halodesulfurarchaeum sp.]|nr:hypothetical protein [Halodesulfurarchaeum sp.]